MKKDKKENIKSGTFIMPYEPKKVGVLIDIQHTNKEIVVADNDEEFRSEMNQIIDIYGNNCIVVKKIVGVIIPISTKSLT